MVVTDSHRQPLPPLLLPGTLIRQSSLYFFSLAIPFIYRPITSDSPSFPLASIHPRYLYVY